jgi:endoglucanase
MPRYGFNFQWMFSWQPGANPEGPDLRALDFMAEVGLDFVRVPMDYRFWTKGTDYRSSDEAALAVVDSYLEACAERELHASLNLHRAPGYCINRPEIESHNLWLDEEARDGFASIWESFARRYKEVPPDRLSFDLLNEPPAEGERGMTRERHESVMRRAVAAIRSVDPDRPIALDGVGGGHFAIPELADLGATHSGRGYMPMAVSHYRAEWWAESAGLPEPAYPGTEWMGRRWDLDALREFYSPWREVESKGVAVHVGECGCYSRTPNEVAMRWLRDLFGLYKEYGWGFALWNFKGPFGVAEHGRPGARLERYKGFMVDRALLDLMLESRAPRVGAIG